MANQWRDRNTLVPDRPMLIFVLSFLGAILLRLAGVDEPWVTGIFWLSFLGFLFMVLLLVRQQLSEKWKYKERKLFESRWGTLGIALLGFALGTLVYHNRAWFIWLWEQFRRINRPDEWMLFSLFLLGVMLGFFVVRNWSKDQKDFVASLTAVFGAAFVSTLLGQLSAQNGSVLTPQNTFSFYALGFSLSGAANLIAFALLIGHYSRTRSLTSRSVIDFLYGSDKAQAIDGYFLKNFEADPNYAKVKLVAALSAYRDVIRIEFARKMNDRKDSAGRTDLAVGYDSPPCDPSSPPDPCAGDVRPPFDYFELLAIRSTPEPDPPREPSPASPPAPGRGTYEILFRRLRPKGGCGQGDPITPEMFRVAISMRWLDSIEYVVTAGQYLKAFPYYGSVAGMALQVRKTIVMNRDRYKKFRTSDFFEGKTPNQADQPRGLYEIDYLSYITVPMASSFGTPEEQSLGVLHLDTKLFAYPKGGLPPGACLLAHNEPGQEVFRILIEAEDEKTLRENLEQRLDEFEVYACNLYTQNDPVVEDLVTMKEVIIPLLELYKKCRTGAINQTNTTAATRAA
ncbi:MAG: hypothetical protein QOG71_3954 [Pyrinomonadaceae bacterium]|nr:hypothetical protein [Pyrinomonadaceae bacterium]